MDDVVGCGSLNVDYIYETRDLSFLDSFYPEREKRRQWVLTDLREIQALQQELRKEARLIARSGGGSAANTVLALARMGFGSGMMGKVGRDEDGDFIREEMAIVPRLRIAPGNRTGQALIILGPDGDRIIVLLPHANRELTWADLDPDFVRTFRMLHDLGIRFVVVKKKGSGALIREAHETWDLPAPVIQAKDTTGAGDVFAAGFLGGLLRGLPPPACGALGLAMAHRSMAGVGREAYPKKADFEAAFNYLKGQ